MELWMLLSKWLVAGSFAFTALWKHDAEIMWALIGAVANTVLSSILKQMFNHERSAPALRSNPGMPSSHAQSIFYAAMFLVLSLFYWLGTNYLAMILGTATLASASYLSWLRVSQRLHTLNQILVGRCCRISLRRSVVRALAFARAESICLFTTGPDYSHPWFSSILCWLRHLHHSPLVSGNY